jgi:hypothetical protein
MVLASQVRREFWCRPDICSIALGRTSGSNCFEMSPKATVSLVGTLFFKTRRVVIWQVSARGEDLARVISSWTGQRIGEAANIYRAGKSRSELERGAAQSRNRVEIASMSPRGIWEKAAM